MEAAIRAKKERSWKDFMVIAFIDGSLVEKVEERLGRWSPVFGSCVCDVPGRFADLSCDVQSSFCNFRVRNSQSDWR
jgi:hypothetical protein